MRRAARTGSFLLLLLPLGLVACSLEPSDDLNTWTSSPYFKKRLLADTPALGEIHDLRLLRRADGEPYELYAGGNLAVGTIADNGSVSVEIVLPPAKPWGKRNRTQLVSSDSEDVLGVLGASGAGKSYDSYLRTDGNIVWEDNFSADTTIFGDLDGSEQPAFAQLDGRGFGGDILRLHTSDKTLLWERKVEWFSEIQFVRHDDGGRRETIVVVARGKRLIGYNATGEKVLDSVFEGLSDSSQIRTAPCPQGNPADDCLLVQTYNGYQFFSLSGETRSNRYFAGRVNYLQTGYWRTSPDAEPMIVISGVHSHPTLSGWQRYIRLYVFRQSGELVFRDSVKGNGGGMAIVPPSYGRRGGIALGGDGRVWLYEPTQLLGTGE